MAGNSLLFTLLLWRPCMAAAEDTPDSIYHPASTPSGRIALILLGVSEGGPPDYCDTKGLNAQGYPCLVAGYFRTRSTPAALELIPLEYFEQLISDYRASPEIADKRLGVWGGSKGGEDPGARTDLERKSRLDVALERDGGTNHASPGARQDAALRILRILNGDSSTRAPR